jgi:hypothetical protein
MPLLALFQADPLSDAAAGLHRWAHRIYFLSDKEQWVTNPMTPNSADTLFFNHA